MYQLAHIHLPAKVFIDKDTVILQNIRSSNVIFIACLNKSWQMFH